MVTPGGSGRSGRRDLAQQQVRESTARLERARALQLFQLQHDFRACDAGQCGV